MGKTGGEEKSTQMMQKTQKLNESRGNLEKWGREKFIISEIGEICVNSVISAIFADKRQKLFLPKGNLKSGSFSEIGDKSETMGKKLLF